MDINHSFYQERVEYFTDLRKQFPEMPDYSWDEASSAIILKRHN